MTLQKRYAWFRLYEELNRYLPEDKRKREFRVPLEKACPVQKVMVALGVPLSEIDLILVNGESVEFSHVLAGEERVIVSEIPGTTRDSIDVRFEKDGRTLIAIDTAGVRKKSKIADDIEFYARSRVMRSIHRADLVLLLIDATVPVGQVDKRLARLVADDYKPCVLVVSKWDLSKGRASTEEFGEYLGKLLPEVAYSPIAFTSAVTGRNMESTIDLVRTYFQLGGMHMQVNVLDRETLLDAKAHPENYHDLIVRISGYCARFVDLSDEMKDEIIARTEFSRW